MALRITNVILGMLLIVSALTEYRSYIKEIGHITLPVLVVIIVISSIGLALIYSGVMNKNILHLFKKK